MLLNCFKSGSIEAGCDEAAGVACRTGICRSSHIARKFTSEILNDSKQLSEKLRYELREIIINELLHGLSANATNTRLTILTS